MPCNKCYTYGQISKPRCPEGKQIYQQVVQTRKEFEDGDGTYQEWVDAWDNWVLHYRGRKKKKSKNKQTEF